MKIALVSPYDFAYPGGVNNHILHLREHFIRMGHEIKIIAPSSRPLNNSQNVIVIGKAVPIRASGSIVRVPVSPNLLFSQKIRQLLARERFDVVHIHEPFLPVLGTAVLHHCSSRELVVATFHAFRSNSWGYVFWKPIILNHWFRKLEGKIVVSRAAMDFISRYFPGEYEIIPNGIDFARFAGVDVQPIPEFCDGKLNVLFVGRIEKRKGFKYLLGAYQRVKQGMPDIRLIVVGPQDRSLQKFRRIASEQNIRDVVFAGYASHEDLPRYYKSADVFCSPATGKESFGLVLLEAMAAGTPPVASSIAGYAGVIKHGKDGILVKPKDETALADVLKQVLNDRSLRERMGEAGRIKAAEYSWNTVAERVMGYYQQLLSSRKR
ncbi:MAG: glycosyltransferase family 4 protein [Dehalococcoidia bacterium]|nr:glycosyltransferase family 4 protein [Dehalococcoidia bacterium]